MATKYQQQRAQRMEDRHVGGRFKSGLLAPVMAHKIMGSEGGMLTQRAFFELDPIPGRLMSNIFGEVVSVFVPLQAIHALANPAADYPGSADVIRAELAAGNALSSLEAENEISKRLGINPKAVAGTKYVDEYARIAYNAAVNFLRRKKYVKASQVLASSTAILPAILSKTVLDRLNGVLDPEDRVDGLISLSGDVPVKGIGWGGSTTAAATNTEALRQSDLTNPVTQQVGATAGTGKELRVRAQDDGTGQFYPDVWADLDKSNVNISLRDFYRAERMDNLVRQMRQFVNDNPEKGEEIVNRWAMGLSLDVGNEPFVIFEQKVALTNNVTRPMDGASIDNVRTYPANGISFTVPVPATEFGGYVITMMAIKPDEVLASQPHPLMTEAWSADNFVADEMALDPVPVLNRAVDSDVSVGDEDTVVFYGANHGLRRTYMQYGWNRHLDTNDVAAETSIWQLEVPASVTPETVSYPNPLPQDPFADTLAEVCTYGIKSMLTVGTPTIFGPSPVEELAEIEDADIFDDA